MAKNVELGSVVKDRVTGFKGVAIGRHEYLTGCNKVTVQPVGITKDGKPYESQWFDEQSLVVVEAAKPEKYVDAEPSPKARTGGPSDQPRRSL